MTSRLPEGVVDRESQFVGEDHEFGCQRPMGGEVQLGEKNAVLEAVSMDEMAERRGNPLLPPDPIRIPPHALLHTP